MQFSELCGHSKAVNSVAWSPDSSQLASASDDGTVRIWNAVTGECVYEQAVGRRRPPRRTFSNQTFMTEVRSVAWSPDGSRLALANDLVVWLLDPLSNTNTERLDDHTSLVMSVDWSPNGRWLASADEDGTVRIWNTGTGQCVHERTVAPEGLNSVAWSPDGSRLASGGDHMRVHVHDVGWSVAGRVPSGVRRWWRSAGDLGRVLSGHTGCVSSVAWSPDGSRLASASNGNRMGPGPSDRTVRVWDTAIGECEHVLFGPSLGVWSVGWSPNGRWLASANFDGTVRVWDAMTGAFVRDLRFQRADGQFVDPQRVTSVAWSPNGSRLASGNSDGTVRVWATGR